MCIITWVLQRKHGLRGHFLYPRKQNGLKNILNCVFLKFKKCRQFPVMGRFRGSGSVGG